METNKYLIDNEIDTQELWRGIGGHFDSLNQIIHEIIDNSISNFKSNPHLAFHTILISITKIDSKNVEIFIEDTGTGIKNINNAFTLGNKKSQESPLNEHGFGLKHALATANPDNNNWAVYTRTEDLESRGLVSVIKSPYKIQEFYGENISFNLDNYPTKLKNQSTGTIVKFVTSYEMYKSLGRNGIKDSKGIALYLKEDLGFIYSGIINANIAEIQLIVDDEPKMIVNSVEPWWNNTSSSKEKVDLGLLAGDGETGSVILSYKIGTINDRFSMNSDNEKAVYYRTNMKSSGVEIRINGRMIKNNLLNEIWHDVYQHNRFNNFLVQINLESDNLSFLPATRSSKNGFKQGDIKLLGLYNWIRTHCKFPIENKKERDEIHLFDELKEIKIKQLKEVVDGKLTVDVGRRVLKRSKENIKIDFFVAFNNNTIIYLGVKGTSSPIDLYKLKLYWDACIIDNLLPTSAILLANAHSDLVVDLSSMNNSLKDINGNSYKFSLKKWEDENIIS